MEKTLHQLSSDVSSILQEVKTDGAVFNEETEVLTIKKQLFSDTIIARIQTLRKKIDDEVNEKLDKVNTISTKVMEMQETQKERHELYDNISNEYSRVTYIF